MLIGPTSSKKEIENFKQKLISKPSNYIAHESSILLGNAIGGRKSNKYYKYKEYILS